MDNLLGLGFRPTDEEIIRLLEKKRLDPDFCVHAIVETNIYEYEPFQLFGLSPIPSDEEWCSFFCAPKYINAHSNNVHRRTNTGSWKITSNDKEIKAKHSTEVIGRKSYLTFYEIVPGCKNIKTDWVMYQFSAKDNSLYKKDFVVCRVKRNGDKKPRVKKNEDKKRRILTNVKGERRKKHRTSTNDEENISPESQLPSSNNPISNSRNHVVEDITPESELLLSNNLISNFRNHGTQNTSPESQLLLEVQSNSNWVSNSRNHIAEDTSSESQLQLLLQLLSSNYSISNFRNHVAENTSLESPIASWLLASNYLISDSRNHVAENTYTESQLLPSLISDSRNHVAENTSPESWLLSEVLASNNWISNSRNYIAGDTFLESQLQLLLSNYLISNTRNHVAENTFSESQLLPSRNHLSFNTSNYVAENTLQAYPSISNAGNGCNGLDQAPFSGLQSPINQEQGSSYSSVSSNNYEVLNSPFGSDPQWVLHDEYPCEETGHRSSTLPPDSNSSKSVGGLCGGDSNDTDTVSFSEWVDDMFVYNIPQV